LFSFCVDVSEFQKFKLKSIFKISGMGEVISCARVVRLLFNIANVVIPNNAKIKAKVLTIARDPKIQKR